MTCLFEPPAASAVFISRGVPSSILFFYFHTLALMPEGDHMNIIDPPGLTVSKN